MNSNSYNTLAQQIKAEALRIGFSACGIAPAEIIDKATGHRFTQWLEKGKHAKMSYMENYRDKRLNPRLLVEGARSIISVALNYYPRQTLKEDQYQFGWYAYGKDYHDIMKEKLNALFTFIQTQTTANGRVFCDTAPILERYWAWQAGLGWIGKNTQLIIPQAGSCFFLGEILLDIELDYDLPMTEQCGSCKRCMDACPTKALEAPHQLDANKCLSYLTIENRGDIPSVYTTKMGNKIYGCDECQKACPWNRFATACTVPELQPSEAFLSMTKEEWSALTEEEYRKLFKGSAVKRAKYEGITRNIKAAESNRELKNKPTPE